MGGQKASYLLGHERVKEVLDAAVSDINQKRWRFEELFVLDSFDQKAMNSIYV